MSIESILTALLTSVFSLLSLDPVFKISVTVNDSSRFSAAVGRRRYFRDEALSTLSISRCSAAADFAALILARNATNCYFGSQLLRIYFWNMVNNDVQFGSVPTLDLVFLSSFFGTDSAFLARIQLRVLFCFT